jgi:hypothetical protein
MKNNIRYFVIPQLPICLLLAMIIFATSQCRELTVENKNLTASPQSPTIDNQKLSPNNYYSGDTLPRRSVIVIEKIDTGKHVLYHFYNEAGVEVKTIRGDRFAINSPVYKLNFPQTTAEERRTNAGMFYQFLADINPESGKMIPIIKTTVKVNELNSLKKSGIVVRNPEKANFILGNPLYEYHSVTVPACKYLVKNESASVFFLNEPERGEREGNALLDCSYLTVYNNLGNKVHEVLIPDKIVDKSLVSDDGRFMLCTYGYSVIWDEGTNTNDEGFLIINLETGEKTYFPMEEARHPSYDNCFYDGYFQITLNSPGRGCSRLIVDPYKRKYYLKTYDGPLREIKRQWIFGLPFIQYHQIPEDLSSFSEKSY